MSAGTLVKQKELEALRRRVAAAVDHLEEIEDLALVRASKREDRRDYLSMTLVKRLIAGESGVRIWRAHRKLTLGQLAKLSNVPVSDIGDIEAGKKPGSAATLRALAAALGVPLERLLAVRREGSANRAARRRELPQRPVKD